MGENNYKIKQIWEQIEDIQNSFILTIEEKHKLISDLKRC